MPERQVQLAKIEYIPKSLMDGETLFGIVTEKIEKDLRRITYDVLINPDEEVINSLTNKGHLPSGCGVVLIHKVYAALFTSNNQDIVAWRNRLKTLLGWGAEESVGTEKSPELEKLRF